MFNWNSDQWKTGGGAEFGGHKLLGILTIKTDEGINGYAFLGSSA